MKQSYTFFILMWSFILIGQERNQIDSVFFTAKKVEQLSIGHSLIHLENHLGQSLGTNLSTQTGAYLKEYGNGMLSSISYRGLGAAHTGVFFEGIPINSGLTGQTDFNLIYPEGFNSIQFRTGGGGAAFGSGAVGGSVHLENELVLDKGFKGSIAQKIASYDTYTTSLETGFSDYKNALKVNFYRLSSQNDYDYSYNNKNLTIENGAVELLSTNLAYLRKINNKNQLKLALNYTLADRQLMESIGASSNQKQKDTNYNSVLSWLYSSTKYSHKLSQAFLYSKYRYFPNQEVTNYDFGQTKDYISQYDGNYKFSSQLKFGITGRYKHTEGKGTSINSPSLDEGFTSINGQYRVKNIKQSLTLAKGVSSEFEIPLTVDYGVEWKLKSFKIHGNIATNYRNPTFNDLYWMPGGNPDLKTEKGWSSELGVTFENSLTNSFQIKLQGNGFYSKFKDWIIWLPNTELGGIFSPINIRDVESYGFESLFNLKYTKKDFKIDWNTNYTYVESIDESLDKQLIYTPKHKLNTSAVLTRKNIFLGIKHQFVDVTYTSSDNLNKLDSFNLIDTSIGYNWILKGFKTSLELSANNILDEDYQLVLGRAMPERNYAVQFKINF